MPKNKYQRKVKFGLLETPFFALINGEVTPVYEQEWNGDICTCRTPENIEVLLHYKEMKICKEDLMVSKK